MMANKAPTKKPDILALAMKRVFMERMRPVPSNPKQSNPKAKPPQPA